MSDWAEGRPEQKEYLDRLFDLMPQTRWLDWLMLTKRPQLIRKLFPFGTHEDYPRGIWQGITAETQRWFDIRWGFLREVPAEVYWLSIEPQFERIVLPKDFLALGQRAWVIVGGESGAGARPLHPDWVRSLRDQCLTAGVPFHFKQWGEHQPLSTSDGFQILPFGKYDVASGFGFSRVGKKSAGRELDGREWNEFPKVVSA